MKFFVTMLLLISSLSLVELNATETSKSAASFDFDESGIKFQTYDTSLSVIMRFRMQNQFTYNSISEDDLSAASNELANRRLRLRFGGVLYRKLSFNIQLGFTRRDWDADDSDVPNVIRDAIVYWNFSPNAQIGFGQAKLPGNRQRVISSGDQQFADRSLVNSRFTLDRDFGFQGLYSTTIFDIPMNFRGAVSTGDGRYAPQMTGLNLDYTGRFEILPFGKFKSGGDYFEGDLIREETPKLSVGVVYSHNEKATRTRGQLGPELLSPRSQEMILSDAVFKYLGFALYGEFAQRNCDEPITGTLDGVPIYVYTGIGYLMQASYFVGENFEIAGRVATVVPDSKIEALKGAEFNRHITGCFNYYIHNHRAKAQIEITHNELENMATNVQKNNWIGRFNVEVGI
jgi:hypothetical protein